MIKQIKSKARVADHGEVFTAKREVDAMLDLVKQETERVDSRFFGGNWLLQKSAQFRRERRNLCH